MLLASSPAKLPAVFANAAGGSFITNPLPVASQVGVTNGAASYHDGFPPNCFVPYAAGGAGPFGTDFNGLGFVLSGGIQWQQAGGPIFYDSSFSTAIGGYPNTAIIKSANQQNVFWESTVDNNTSDPDTGGANWQKFAPAGSLCAVQTFTGAGVHTYTPTPGATSAIIYGVGAGGAGGGSAACSGSQGSAGAGGSSGSFGRVRVASLATQTVTIGTPGAGVSGSNGAAGGLTSIGTWLSCPGGPGGAAGGATAGPSVTAVAAGGGVPTIGGGAVDIWATDGACATNGLVLNGSPIAVQSGLGANSAMGNGGINTNGVPSGNNGSNAVGYGAGGSGSASQPSTGPFTGGSGSAGIVVVEEYF